MSFIEKHEISIVVERETISEMMTPVLFEFDKTKYRILIQDEYDDLRRNNSVLDLILVLRELAVLTDSSDYIAWCQAQSIDMHKAKLNDYFSQAVKIAEKISHSFPDNQIDYEVSDLGFQLNTGTISILRDSS